jgi:RHS repeat-associated protein
VVRDLNNDLTIATEYLNGLGIDGKLRQTTGGSTSYFLADHLGSTRGLTDATGNVTSSLTYDSFGTVVGGSGSTRYTYTGRELDEETGLIYYRARWYDPQQGRFVSEDPIGLVGGINLFAYVENNPICFSDPSGLCPQEPSKPSFTPPTCGPFVVPHAASLEGIKCIGDGDCVPLVQNPLEILGQQYRGLPHTRNWRQGPRVKGNSSIEGNRYSNFRREWQISNYD